MIFLLLFFLFFMSRQLLKFRQLLLGIFPQIPFHSAPTNVTYLTAAGMKITAIVGIKCAEMQKELTESQRWNSFHRALASQAGICVARGMKTLNGVVRMGLAALEWPLHLHTGREYGGGGGIEHAAIPPEAGAAKSLFTESRSLLKHIAFQSIRAHRPLPLHHAAQAPNLTMTKSHLQILNFIILICQVWHLISGSLTCVCLALWRAPFVPSAAAQSLGRHEERVD